MNDSRHKKRNSRRFKSNRKRDFITKSTRKKSFSKKPVFINTPTIKSNQFKPKLKNKNKTNTIEIFNLIKKNIITYGWFSLISLIILKTIVNSDLVSSVIMLLILINSILLLIFYSLKPFIWINKLDLSDDLKYYGVKLLSVVLVIGIIIFFLYFGSNGSYFLSKQDNVINNINLVLYTIFYLGTLLWLLILSGFLGLRKKRRATGIFIWDN